MAKEYGPHKLYKGSYFIVFYDEFDEYLEYMFDNVCEILKFMEKPITYKNKHTIVCELRRALQRNNHITRFLTGKPLRVYIISTK